MAFDSKVPHPVINTSVSEKRILWAEDDEDTAFFLQEFFKAYGFNVTVVSDGITAIAEYDNAIAHQQPFSLVILDIAMAPISGHEVAVEIRKNNPDAKIMFFTAFDTMPNRFQAEDEEVAFIPKHTELPKLAEILNEALKD